ncbi:MAG: hypothetical protein CL494_05110 [Actinobacteria bacterium]|mgnify:CR=1 FL=1|nr:hypothetical protein [Actinomycetota bacterium]|tara:strand:+ start:3817 stop:4413 length:597 start_codon:yes stop_codon:yes gene_type:complete
MSLWDVLPIEIQEIILSKSIDLTREEYLNTEGKKHEKRKRRQGRGLVTPDMIRYAMSSTTDPYEILSWAFPLEMLELQMCVDPPVELEVVDFDYNAYFTTWLERCCEYMSAKENANAWITPTEDQWLAMFTKLNDFKRKFSHLDILSEYFPDRNGLFFWLEVQKDDTTYLSREKRRSLQSLGVRLSKFKPPPVARTIA